MATTRIDVLYVIDRSGSMARLRDDVIGGFNSYLDGLRDERADAAMGVTDGGEIDYYLTLTLFDSQIDVGEPTPLSDVKPLDRQQYRPGGSTALLDAIGDTLAAFRKVRPELGEGDRVMLVVQTDGQENSSQEFTAAGIRDMIQQREATGKWGCLFVGAGPDTWEQAAHMGFRGANTVSVAASGNATRGTYHGLVTGTRSFSRGGTAEESADAVAKASGGETKDDGR